MQLKKRLALLLSLLLIASLSLGCAAQNAGGAILVSDMLGREVALQAPAKKIVALNPADCEILYAIGAGGALVGRGEYCSYPPEALDVASVQSGSETNLEQIIALSPELVVMSTMTQAPEQVEALESAGIKVYISDAANVEQVYQNITNLGALTGEVAEAAAVVDGMKTAFTSVEERASAAGAEQKTVYFEVSPLEYGLWTAGAGTFMDEIAAMLGLKNAFSDVQGWAEVSEEQVIERNPDYIVTIAMYFGSGVLPVDEILGRGGWENVTAVKNAAVFNADSNEISLPGPRLADGAEALCDFVYGSK